MRALPGYARLTPEGRDYVERALRHDHERSIGAASLHSVSGALPSDKSGTHVEYESKGVEGAYVRLCQVEHRSVGLLAQPKQVSFAKLDSRGNRRHSPYTADYLNFETDLFYLVECKSLEDLKKLADKYADWKLVDGEWTWGSAVAFCERLGMGFRIFCPNEHPKAFLTNLQYFCRVPRTDLLRERPRLLAQVLKRVLERPRTIGDLCAELEGVTGGFLYQAIDRGKLFGLTRLQEFDKDFLIFGSLPEATKHESDLAKLRLSPDLNLGPLHLKYITASNAARRDAVVAMKRYELRRVNGLPRNSTDRRNEKALAKAAVEGAPRIAAFIPLYEKRGGSGPCMEQEDVERIARHGERYFRKCRTPHMIEAFADYVCDAELFGYHVPCQETYRKIVRLALSPERIAFMTGGKRAYWKARPMTDGAKANSRLLIAGLHVHTDGVYGDAWSTRDEEGLYEMPIYYPFIDDATGYVLSRGLKLGRPSRMAVAMAHRRCIQRHGFLPINVVHDWGSELENNFVPEAQAHFNIGYERRPVGAPRFGARVESFNAQLTAYCQSLAGGTYFDKAGRSADGSKKGRRTARYTIAELIRKIDHWIFEIWNKTPIGPNDETPEELFNASLKCFPDAFVEVGDSPLTRYFTSLPLESANFTYDRGYRYGGKRYSSDDYVEELRRGDPLSGPRLDCDDPSQIHAMTESGPVPLRALDYDREGGWDVGKRAEEQRKLFLYGSKAKKNQFDRNIKEAKTRRDAEKAAAAIRDAGNGAVPKDKPRPAVGPNFADVLLRPRQTLKRLN